MYYAMHIKVTSMYDGDITILLNMGVSILLGTHNYPHLIRVVSDQSANLLLVCQR